MSELASRINEDDSLARHLELGNLTPDSDFNAIIEREFARFSDLSSVAYSEPDTKERFGRFLLEMAKRPHRSDMVSSSRIQERSNDFLLRFPPERQAFGKDLLDLARASYSLRDDDNIHLGRIEGVPVRCVEADGELELPVLPDLFGRRRDVRLLPDGSTSKRQDRTERTDRQWHAAHDPFLG